jgi:hypothetical protein
VTSQPIESNTFELACFGEIRSLQLPTFLDPSVLVISLAQYIYDTFAFRLIVNLKDMPKGRFSELFVNHEIVTT